MHELRQTLPMEESYADVRPLQKERFWMRFTDRWERKR